MQVRAKVKCFVGNVIREPGEVFNYDGPENKCLEAMVQAAPLEVPKAGKPPGGRAKPVIDKAFE